VSAGLAAVLTRRAIEIGFDRLTYAELGMVAAHQREETARWADSDSAEARFRRRLHANLGLLATRTAETRR
jgi:hypothetical protein